MQATAGTSRAPTRGSASRAERWIWLAVALAVATALGTATTRSQANPVLAAVTVAFFVGAWHRTLLAWPVLLGAVLVVIMFIPMRRYAIGGGLPIALEPYRLVIALVLTAWVLALLVDHDTRLLPIGIEAPLIAFATCMLLSLALNVHSIVDQGITGPVVKQLSFFLSFFLVMYFAASAIRTQRQLDLTIMVLVLCGAVVAGAAVVESRTHFNLFDHLSRFVPLLRPVTSPDAMGGLVRGGRLRAMASAQHPIALSAALAILLPLAVYLFRRSRHVIWLGCMGLLVLGTLSTTSRTGAVMLAVLLVCFLWLKRAETVRLLPLLIPLLICVQIAMPGTLGTFHAIFFPEGGSVISEQQGGAGTGTGRVADLGPSLQIWQERPMLGQGFGTRLTSGEDALVNAPILDDEWLNVLLEVGALGFASLLWLYVRSVRHLARLAKSDPSPRGWLLAGIAGAIVSFAVGMATYDAFSFIQVTFLSFILIGLGAAAIRLGETQSQEA